MKYIFTLLTLVFFSACNNNKPEAENKTTTTDSAATNTPITIDYKDSVLVYKYEGSDAKLNGSYFKTISEPLKAILAYYCYQFSTACEDGKNCKLTNALGFEQDSPEHKNLVLKWFKDEDTKIAIENGGNVKPSDDGNYSWFSSITLFVKDNNVKVKYVSSWLTKDLHGKGNGNDDYIIEGGNIKVVNRSHTELDIQ